MRTPRPLAIGIVAVAFSCSVDALAVMPGGAQQPPAQPATAAPAIKLAPETLDKLLAPVALYPDQLLSQMLICCGQSRARPGTEWMADSKRRADGDQASGRRQAARLRVELRILVLFPQVVNYMADNIAWTKELGQAFTADRQGVLDSVQRLRAQSQKAGNLKTTPQQKVETKTTSSGDQVIVIEPANPQVVYVPQYNPQVVYTQPSTTTVVVQEESNSTTEAVVARRSASPRASRSAPRWTTTTTTARTATTADPYMYNDDWDDFYEDRQDAREDIYEDRQDMREDVYENREDARRERQREPFRAFDDRAAGADRTAADPSDARSAGPARRSANRTRRPRRNRAAASAGTQSRSASARRAAYEPARVGRARAGRGRTPSRVIRAAVRRDPRAVAASAAGRAAAGAADAAGGDELLRTLVGTGPFAPSSNAPRPFSHDLGWRQKP